MIGWYSVPEPYNISAYRGNEPVVKNVPKTFRWSVKSKPGRLAERLDGMRVWKEPHSFGYSQARDAEYRRHWTYNNQHYSLKQMLKVHGNKFNEPQRFLFAVSLRWSKLLQLYRCPGQTTVVVFGFVIFRRLLTACGISPFSWSHI